MRPLLLTLLILIGSYATEALAFDPIRDDISEFTFAAELRPSVQRPGATLVLRARHPDGRLIDEIFELHPVKRTSQTPEGADHLFMLRSEDKGRLAAVRLRIGSWKDSHPGTEGSLSFDLDLGEETGIVGTLWVSPTRGAPFQMILKNASLS